MKYFLIIILILLPIVSAYPVYVVETNLDTYKLSETDGFGTNSIITDGKYSAELLDKNDKILYKQFFDVELTIEVFPGPECFDEEMYLDKEKCPEPYTDVETDNIYVRLQIPKNPSADKINIYEEEKLLFSISVKENKDFTKIYFIAGIILLLLILIFAKKYKSKNNNKSQVIL